MTAIIIINYRNERLTQGFVLHELAKLDDTDYSVVVVNNGATTLSDAALSEALCAPVVKDVGAFQVSENGRYILSSVENLGFARGNNLGADFAVKCLGADFLLFSNNDIRVTQSDTLSVLRQTLTEHPEAGIIGPKIVGLKGELQSPEPYQSFWDRYVWMYLSTPFMSLSRKQQRFNLRYADTAAEGSHYKVMGAFFMMRASDFFRCGKMDPNTFLYAEEMILSERLSHIGMSVYYCPRVSVIHAHGATTSKVIGQKGVNKYRLESDIYYYRTYRQEPEWKIRLGMWIFSVITKFM